jgi:nitroreductase
VKFSTSLADLAETFFLKVYSRYSDRMLPKQSLRFRCLEDMRRFQDHAWLHAQGIYRPDCLAYRDAANLSAVITMEYHRIEKGLALPDRRRGASQDVVQRLIMAIGRQLDESGPSAEGAIGLRTLAVYFDETPTQYLDPATTGLLGRYDQIRERYAAEGPTAAEGGYHEVSAESILAHAGRNQTEFLLKRHSVRDFSQENVDPKTIKETVRIAMRAPSVCNRQAWSVYALTDRAKISAALAFQNGNRGFTDRVPLLFVIASDLRRFVSVEERNQAWIDGGLFSMNLALSLLAKEMGSCMLNWCATRDHDQALRRLLGIPDYEVVIMMMAAGYLPSVVKITASPRREVDAILQMCDS